MALDDRFADLGVGGGGGGWEGEAFLTQEQQRSVNEDPKKQTVDQYHMHNMDLNARALFQNML